MDPHLAQFLAAVRPRVNAKHRVVLEDVAFEFGAWLRRRRRRAITASAADLRGFVAAWYLRGRGASCGLDVRRFLAGVRLFAAWHASHGTPGRGRRLRALVAAATRDTLRAAHAGALLDRERPAIAPGGGGGADGFWQVTLRGAEHVVLRDLHSGVCVGPVGLPRGVVGALPAGAVLNLRLHEHNGAWAVSEHGACYPALVSAELRREPVPAGSA